MPVTAPALKATSRPPASDWVAACGGAHVGAHRDVHADEAGRAGQDRADQEADRRPSTTSSRPRTMKTTTPTAAMVVYWRFR